MSTQLPPGPAPMRDPSHRRILLFPGIFGEEQSFCDLRDALQDGYDTAVVAYPGVTAPTRQLMDIDEAAAAIVARLTAEQTGDPALVVGYSYGANLAFAVAGRLLAGGRRVALLALLDPALPTTQFTVHQRGPASAASGVPLPRPGLTYRSRLLRTALAGLGRLGSARARRRLQRRTLWTLRSYARRAWAPRRIACPVLHLVSQQFAPATREGWAELCPDIRQFDVEGRHVDLLKGTALAQVVAALRAELDAVSRPTQPDRDEAAGLPPPARPRPHRPGPPDRTARTGRDPTGVGAHAALPGRDDGDP